jgi:hypothetical protein
MTCADEWAFRFMLLLIKSDEEMRREDAEAVAERVWKSVGQIAPGEAFAMFHALQSGLAERQRSQH